MGKDYLSELGPLNDIVQLVAMAVLEINCAPVRSRLGDGVGVQFSRARESVGSQ